MASNCEGLGAGQLGRVAWQLREAGQLVDCRLVCQDGKTLPAHRLVLAAGSPFLASLVTGSEGTV